MLVVSLDHDKVGNPRVRHQYGQLCLTEDCLDTFANPSTYDPETLVSDVGLVSDSVGCQVSQLVVLHGLVGLLHRQEEYQVGGSVVVCSVEHHLASFLVP